MAIDKSTLNKLQRFAQVFKEARERGANESDTSMFLVKFFEDVLGYDSLKGEISKECAIKDRYCDVALKIDGTVRVLVECKAAGINGLTAKHIEQAENYASRAGIHWILLSNGIEWKLFHVSFGESEGITHDLAFELDFIGEIESDPENLWSNLALLCRDSVEEDELEHFWEQRKCLSPASLVRVLFTEDVIRVVRRELNRGAIARLEIEDVFKAIRDVVSKDALLDAGDITFKKRRKRRRKEKKESIETIVKEAVQSTDNSTPVATVDPPCVATVPTNPGPTE